MYNYNSTSYPMGQYTRPISSSSISNNDRIVGGGFIGPFLLGGITGGLLAPSFYPRPYPRPYPPYPSYPYYGPYRPYY